MASPAPLVSTPRVFHDDHPLVADHCGHQSLCRLFALVSTVMDDHFQPGIGIGTVVSLAVPFLGAAFVTFVHICLLALVLLRVNIGVYTLARMLINLAAACVLGLLPFVGGRLQSNFRAISRNATLLHEYLTSVRCCASPHAHVPLSAAAESSGPPFWIETASHTTGRELIQTMWALLSAPLTGRNVPSARLLRQRPIEAPRAEPEPVSDGVFGAVPTVVPTVAPTAEAGDATAAPVMATLTRLLPPRWQPLMTTALPALLKTVATGAYGHVFLMAIPRRSSSAETLAAIADYHQRQRVKQLRLAAALAVQRAFRKHRLASAVVPEPSEPLPPPESVTEREELKRRRPVRITGDDEPVVKNELIG